MQPTTVSSRASATPAPTAVLVEVATPPPSPRTTPPGTPAPAPSEAVIESVAVPSPTLRPQQEPTPTPDPAVWRIQGYVVDEAGKPLESVCVVVGPHGCQRFSPHTDENGHYYLDVAHGPVNTKFDFYFEMPGHQTVWWQVTPNGPTEFNVVLRKG